MWVGYRKWLLLFSVFSAALWLGAYWVFNNTGDVMCVSSTQECFDFWLETIGAPFYGGHLLFSMITAPLIMLFTSRTAVRVWAIMSVAYLPLVIYDLIFRVPISQLYFNKLSMNLWYGDIYFALTIMTATLVPLISWGWAKSRGIQK